MKKVFALVDGVKREVELDDDTVQSIWMDINHKNAMYDIRDALRAYIDRDDDAAVEAEIDRIMAENPERIKKTADNYCDNLYRGWFELLKEDAKKICRDCKKEG